MMPPALSSLSLSLQDERAAISALLALVMAVVGLGRIAWCWWRRVSGPTRIAELWVYPIKSCAGVRMDDALLHVRLPPPHRSPRY
jgi:hypothetical protein